MPLFGERKFEVDEGGRTCLHWAVVAGSLPVMRYLVDQCGFDLSLRIGVSCEVVCILCSCTYMTLCVCMDACKRCMSMLRYVCVTHLHVRTHEHAHVLLTYMYTLVEKYSIAGSTTSVAHITYPDGTKCGSAPCGTMYHYMAALSHSPTLR